MYRVTDRQVSASPHLATPGEHYTVEDPERWVIRFRKIEFFRTKDGSEIATDDLGVPITPDGDLFRAVKTAVEQYDGAPPGVT